MARYLEVLRAWQNTSALGKVSSGNSAQLGHFEGIEKQICMGKSEFNDHRATWEFWWHVKQIRVGKSEFSFSRSSC